MNETASDEQPQYIVVINDDGMYSIWPDDPDMPTPAGWEEPPEPCRGTKEVCLGHIERVWTDMRPRSVRA